ncbi:N-acetylmuramoyl-L-alanine amidase family protein [Lachnospira sp.]|jgi:N-acetylmuramoyl-L-alanine amidase|uniref:N-acetylmuramoyl-L-alanine amidase family protein n=1 Tax=Lachnospira sp. TaxID=2049031 RepID=UPI002ED20254
MSKYKILIDYGHGNTKPGNVKGSPDGFKEWQGNRKLGKRLKTALENAGYDVYEVVTENSDVPLSTRVARINKWCKQFGAGKCILISCHSNAAGNGKWMNARGWSIWTTKG